MNNRPNATGSVILPSPFGRGAGGEGNPANATPPSQHTPKRRSKPRRRGMAIIFALVCLIIAAVMAAVVARIAVRGWKAARDEGRRAQAVWLVESGLRRAAARLAVDPDYQGETWQIAADVLDGRHNAAVLIEVKPNEDANRRTVHVRADYPDAPVHRIRQSKQLVVTLAPPKSLNP